MARRASAADEERAKSRKYIREWRAANPEKVRKYAREWRARDPEKLRAYNREYLRRWRAVNRDKARAYDAARYRKISEDAWVAIGRLARRGVTRASATRRSTR